MKHIFTIPFLLGFYIASAQQVVKVADDNIAFRELLYNVGGQHVVKYVAFKSGSPFFKEDWLTTSITLANGKIFNGFQGKLDVMAGSFIYKDENGVELVAQAPIKQIDFIDANDHYVFVSASSIQPTSKKGWYQQLQNGKVSLYKQFEKIVIEQQPFNSATVEQSVKTTEKYYLLKNNALIPLKKPKDLLEALNDKSAELEKFKKEKSNASLEKTLVEIVGFYNTLFN